MGASRRGVGSVHCLDQCGQRPLNIIGVIRKLGAARVDECFWLTCQRGALLLDQAERLLKRDVRVGSRHVTVKPRSDDGMCGCTERLKGVPMLLDP
jgi:hypothetical protein